MTQSISLLSFPNAISLRNMELLALSQDRLFRQTASQGFAR
jgi:hypothetical protein